MLVNLSKFKQNLRIYNNDDDDFLNDILSGCYQYVQSWLNRNFEVRNYEDFFIGTNCNYHFFKNYPLILINQIKENETIIQKDFDIIESKKIYLSKNFVFNRNSKYKIQYQAGFDILPVDLEQAIYEFASYKYKQYERIGTTSKQIQGENNTFIYDDIPPSVKTILKNYKKTISW